MTPVEALRRVLFLKTLPTDVLAQIAVEGDVRSLGRGEMLIAEHAPCIGLIVVLAGAVKIYKLDRRGRELTLGREEAGGSVVELPLFDGGNYPAGAEAAEDGTRVIIVKRDRFQRLMAAHPAIAHEALRALAIRMRRQIEIIEAQALHTVRARLAAYLLRIADGRALFTLTETNDAIASEIGTVREVVSRTLGSFRDDGAICLNARQIEIRDIAMLKRLTDSSA